MRNFIRVLSIVVTLALFGSSGTANAQCPCTGTAPAPPPPVLTSVVTTKVTSVKDANGTYTITITGSFTLGTGGTYTSAGVTVTDAAGNVTNATFNPALVPPAAGATVNFTATVTSAAAGTYTATSSMKWVTAGGLNQTSQSVVPSIAVPQP